MAALPRPLIMTAVKTLITYCLLNATVQGNTIWYNGKESLAESLANSPRIYGLSFPSKVSMTNAKGKLKVTFGNLESTISMAHRTSQSTTAKHRSKRVVFSGDDRVVIPPKLLEKCPFSAAVRISTGCSGVLVSPKHVLTSAHCLHNGSHYVEGYKSLKVGFLMRNGTTEWREISSTKMSKLWKKGSDPSATKYDYALIKLYRNHSRCFLPISPSRTFLYGTHCAHEAIHFSGFDEDRKKGTLLYRSCQVLTYSANLLYHCCDAQRGSSGAGVYEIRRPANGKYLRYVVGVFSGNRDRITRGPPQSTCTGHSRRIWFTRYYRANYNAALRFKEQDVYHICTWMRRLGGENCEKFLKERRRKRRQSARKRRERSKEAYARCQGTI